MAFFKRVTACVLAALLLANCAASAQRRNFGEVIDDEAIAFSLKAKYMKDREVPANDISIGVWKGIVTLKGEIERQEHINRAIEIAERQKGVKEVKAFLVLKEYGRLQETGKRPFYKKWFKKSEGDRGTSSRERGNKGVLREKDLTDESSPASPGGANPDPVPTTEKVQETEADNLDSEQEF